MEAEEYGTRGEIGVIATKEEWQEVIDALMLSPHVDREGNASGSLVHWLINQGVYE